MKKSPKTLFFIKNTTPSPEEIKAIEGMSINVMVRNASKVSGTLETCEQVAGRVPDAYKDMKGVKVLDVKIEEPKEDPKAK